MSSARISIVVAIIGAIGVVVAAFINTQSKAVHVSPNIDVVIIQPVNPHPNSQVQQSEKPNDLHQPSSREIISAEIPNEYIVLIKGSLKKHPYEESASVNHFDINVSDRVIVLDSSREDGWFKVQHQKTGKVGFMRNGIDFSEVSN